jgi:hypothetical protein
VADRDFLLKLQKQLADEGKLAEAGWIGFRLAVVPKDAPPIQLSEMKMAFMAGAMHVFTALMGVLDEGTQETEADLRRMDLLHKELEAFGAQFKERAKARGH